MRSSTNASPGARHEGAWQIFLVFLRLGMTSFGGPIAHLAYFRNEFVERRRWLSEHRYIDLVALCQFLPGPASSQVGFALGMMRGGWPGALAAWLGFTVPSAVILVIAALGLAHWGNVFSVGALHGLKIVAVAVVTQAVWAMARNLCSDKVRATIATASASAVLLWPSSLGQICVMFAGTVIGLLCVTSKEAIADDELPIKLNRGIGILFLVIFLSLLVGLPVLTRLSSSHSLAVFSAFYQAGALVFGGGHIVMPLLQSAVVPNGWVSNDHFLAGYGLVQAVPGPLFTFSAFLGASMAGAPNGWTGAALCLVAIFLPSLLLLCAALPFWEQLRRSRHTQAALAGVNATVVGLLIAALYNPVWTSAIGKPIDLALAIVAFAALHFWKIAPWLVVAGTATVGWLIGSFL